MRNRRVGRNWQNSGTNVTRIAVPLLRVEQTRRNELQIMTLDKKNL